MNEPWPDIDELERAFQAEHGETIRRARARHTSCPSVQMIVAVRGESFPEELRARIEEHLAHCESCRMLAEDLQTEELPARTAQEKARMRARLEPVLGATNVWDRLRGWALRPIPIGALSALVLALGALILIRNLREQPSNVARVKPPTPPALLAALPLERPSVPGPQDSELIWRGGETGSATYEDELDAALIPYGKDDYASASKKLEQIERKYPGKFEPRFYNGICLLYLNDATGAEKELEAAKQLGKPPRNYEAAWYLAIAEQRAGLNDLAFAEAQALCKANSPYAPRACEATKSKSPR